MSRRTLPLDDKLYAYLVDHTVREPAVFRQLREETGRMPNAQCQISPEQGQFMALLVECCGARRAIEIGTFTGYSALWVAAALPPDGHLVCCDVNKEWTAIAQRYWQAAGLADKIELRLGPGAKSIDALLAASAAGTFDFAFIDADKTGYDVYYEGCLKLLRPGGLIAVDNALSDGRVLKPKGNADAAAIDALNRKVCGDQRVSQSLVPIGDGLLLVRKR
jgi:predicted O-methyltransferase YrrM